jgi:hypothetical protein
MPYVANRPRGFNSRRRPPRFPSRGGNSKRVPYLTITRATALPSVRRVDSRGPDERTLADMGFSAELARDLAGSIAGALILQRHASGSIAGALA